MALFTSIGVSGVSAVEQMSPYEKVFNSINDEYDLNLGYAPVDGSEISLEDYEKYVRQVAIEQREVLDRIELIKSQTIMSEIASFSGVSTQSTVTKTRTKNCWGNLSGYYKCTCTYNVTGSVISYMRNAYLTQTTLGKLTNTLFAASSGPTYYVFDGGRTGSVSYKGTIYYNGNPPIYNYTCYTEFYYNS